jgi:transcription elongation factor SPT6
MDAVSICISIVVCYYSMKYVKNKPVRDLTGDQYLKLTLAEADKMITISISERIDGITSPSYIEEVKQLYYRVRL